MKGKKAKGDGWIFSCITNENTTKDSERRFFMLRIERLKSCWRLSFDSSSSSRKREREKRRNCTYTHTHTYVSNIVKYNAASLGESLVTKYAEQPSWKVASFSLQLPSPWYFLRATRINQLSCSSME